MKQSEMDLGVKFKPPTLEQVLSEALKIGMSYIEAQKFYSYHQAGGWMIGRTKMKSWKDALNYWRLRSESSVSNSRTVYELTKIIEAKRNLANQLKNQFSTEHALGRNWSREEERKEYARLCKEIKQLNEQLAGM